MWKRRKVPELVIGDCIDVVDDALCRLGQPALSENDLFEADWWGTSWVQYTHLLANGSPLWFDIDSWAITVGLHFPEVYEAGRKQISFSKDDVVTDLCRILSSPVEIIREKEGKVFELRFLDSNGEPFFRNRYYGKREESIQSIRFGPAIISQ